MKKKILIVDDSESVRINIKNILGDNYTLIDAVHGSHALDVLGANKDIDLIVLDVNMPEMNGLEFIKIQSEKEEIKHIPTMMCTTEASAEIKSQAKESGVVRAWIMKPITNKKAFLRAVEIVLK